MENTERDNLKGIFLSCMCSVFKAVLYSEILLPTFLLLTHFLKLYQSMKLKSGIHCDIGFLTLIAVVPPLHPTHFLKMKSYVEY